MCPCRRATNPFWGIFVRFGAVTNRIYSPLGMKCHMAVDRSQSKEKISGELFDPAPNA